MAWFGTIVQQLEWTGAGDMAAYRDCMLDAGLGISIAARRRWLDEAEATMRAALACGTATASAGCRTSVRYLASAARGQPPQVVFAQLMACFELADADPRVVGVNFVQPEDWYVSRRDYDLHVRMFEFLRGAYPRVGVSRHARELALGQVPPEDLGWHIRRAVESGVARRIGHGADVMTTLRAPDLLREMARRGIAVEINLSSNDYILGLRGPRHPLRTYLRAGVPVVLTTDDEGVSRTDLTNEYQRAVEEHAVTYVVVTMFEVGNDTGDRPGELQDRVERRKLDTVVPFPQGYRDLRTGGDGVLAVLTGVGNVRSAATIMALGLDPRFDLSKAYWVVAGIAGGDPADTSMGSAAWAEWIVDGDLGHEIDAREIPAEWLTGFVPLRKAKPYDLPRVNADTFEAFRLSPDLVEWAYRLTRSVELLDTDVMREERARYPETAARRPPFVMKGDTLSSSTFWTGRRLNEWANGWVRYHTDHAGQFVTTAMEDTGTLQSLTWLARAGRVDLTRVLVLRTVSNFDQPPPGMTAAEGLARTNSGHYLGFLPAVEAAFRVGGVFVRAITRGWETFGERRTRESRASGAEP